MKNSEEKERIVDNIFEQMESFYYDEKYEEAIHLLNKLLEEYFDYFEPWNLHLWLGRCYYEIEDSLKAVDHLTSSKNALAKSKTPGNDIDYLQTFDFLGRSLWLLEKYDLALQNLEECETYINNYEGEVWKIQLYEFRIIKGRVYLWHSRFNDALDQFMMAEQLHPKDGSYKDSEAALNYDFGLVYHNQLNHEKAKEYFDLVDINDLPERNQSHYLFNMAIHSGLRERYTDVLEYFEKLEARGIPDEFAAELYNMVARAQYEQGNFDEARRHLKKSKEYPQNFEQLKQSIEDLSRLLE